MVGGGASHFMTNPNQVCRNCGGGEFYTKDVSLMGEAGELIPVGIFASRNIRLRVCGSCGLLDLFVISETLERVKVKFSKDS
jgi:hypothetical protein